jgi:hypothetical protein
MCIHNILCRKPIGVFRKAGKRPKKATKVRKDIARIAIMTLRRVPIRVMRDSLAAAHHHFSCQGFLKSYLFFTRSCGSLVFEATYLVRTPYGKGYSKPQHVRLI